MLKLTIYVSFTIKNILVLSSLLFSYTTTKCTQTKMPTLTVADFITQLPEVLKFTRENTDTGCTIHVTPKPTWFFSLTGAFIAKWNDFSESFTFRNIGFAIVSGALSLGVVSYFLCAYIIYKMYHLTQIATSWINWCSDDELFLDDEILYEKLALHHVRRLKDKNLLMLHQEKNFFLNILHLIHFYVHIK